MHKFLTTTKVVLKKQIKVMQISYHLVDVYMLDNRLLFCLLPAAALKTFFCTMKVVEMKEKTLEGIIILQTWRKGAITLLTDTSGQLISHVQSYEFDMDDEECIETLLDKVGDICKNEHREFKGVLVQLYFDQKDAKFNLTHKFCNSCKEFFDENNIFFHITAIPTLSAYTAIINSQTIVASGERIMIVMYGDHYYMGEIKNYCIQILARTDSNSYQIIHTSLITEETALAATNEKIREKYTPKKVILLQLFPKSASTRPSSSTSETNYFLAAKKIFKSCHPICIPQSFATLSMEAGAKMLMALINGYEDQFYVLPHCRDRYAIISSLNKKFLIKIEMSEYLPVEVSVVFDVKVEGEVVKLVALDNIDKKAYVLAQVNPSDFECQKVRAVLKLDINSLYDFYVEPAGDDVELTNYLDDDYSYEEEVYCSDSDDDESVSTCVELSDKEEVVEEEDNNGGVNLTQDSSSEYEDIEDGFDNSTIEWNDSDEDDEMNEFDGGSVTSIESFMENDPGYKIRVIFDKQYFWIFTDESGAYEKIPIYIAFNEAKPAVGDVAKRLHETEPSFVLYDLIEICSNLNELVTDPSWPFTLKNDSDGILSFFFESINGPTKSTPDFLLAIILKHCLKIIKQKTGERIYELVISFNFPNPSAELKNVFCDAAKLLPQKPKLVFS